jgi:hypothetical protein
MSILLLPQSVPAVMVPRDGLSIAVDVALILLAAVGVIFLVVAAVQLRRVGSLVQALRVEAGRKAEPLLDRSRSIAANVEYISATVRTDVERVNGSVRALSDRLQQAADRMEERIEEFNALMEVVQDEAESAFVGTASTVRGLRAGAHTLTRPLGDGERGDAAALAPGRRSDESGGGEATVEAAAPASSPVIPPRSEEESPTSERRA